MDTLHYLLQGFGVALQPVHLFYLFIGVLGGTLVGVLPAIGPLQAIALLLPAAIHLEPVAAIIMLAGVHYGGMYGGSTTSILVNVPGEASSVVTCLEGHPMAKKGRAGPALGIAAFGSFIAGSLGIVGLMLFAPVLGRAALTFGSPEYFSLMLMSLTIVAYMARGSMVKALMMVAWGLILSTVGADKVSGDFRFMFDQVYLQDGLHIIPLVIGLFGVREVFNMFHSRVEGEVLKAKIKGLFPTLLDWKDSIFPILRGSVLGFFMGILPGVSPMIPTFISYGLEKRLSRHPEKFGTGVIEGVAGPEACNNATVNGMQIPLFSLGIPTNVMNAMFLAALTIFGMAPGPHFIHDHPDLFFGLVASMYLGNIMLLAINLPLIPVWVRVLRIPPVLLNAIILVLCIIGAYSDNAQIGDVYVLIIFGVVGFVGKKLGFEPALLILAFILGPKIEISLRQSLIISSGSFSVFFTRPITAVFIGVTFLVIVHASISALRKKRKEGVSMLEVF